MQILKMEVTDAKIYEAGRGSYLCERKSTLYPVLLFVCGALVVSDMECASQRRRDVSGEISTKSQDLVVTDEYLRLGK